MKPESLGDVVAEFLREDPWDAVKKRFQKVGNDLWAYIEDVNVADVVVWATMLVVSGIASYGVGRVCEKCMDHMGACHHPAFPIQGGRHT